MAEGPGKYDDLVTLVREKTGAAGVLLIVLDGNKGSGFSVHLATHSEIDSMLQTVRLLRHMADQIEADAKARQS